jgi:hypothetical protein
MLCSLPTEMFSYSVPHAAAASLDRQARGKSARRVVASYLPAAFSTQEAEQGQPLFRLAMCS